MNQFELSVVISQMIVVGVVAIGALLRLYLARNERWYQLQVQKKMNVIRVILEYCYFIFVIGNVLTNAQAYYLSGSTFDLLLIGVNLFIIVFWIHIGFMRPWEHIRIKPFEYKAKRYNIMVVSRMRDIPRRIDLSLYPGDMRMHYCDDCGARVVFDNVDYDNFVAKANFENHLRMICTKCVSTKSIYRKIAIQSN